MQYTALIKTRFAMSIHPSTAHSAATENPIHAQLSTSNEDNFLLAVGKRVREFRARRAMTRRQVAREADVSERHLAQLEAGEGNISIVLLRRIAIALNISLSELFLSETEQPAEKIVIQRFLERLPAHRLGDVTSRLMHEFADEVKTRRARIALIGLRGAGKSTLGAKVWRGELKAPFIELDGEIEKDAGIPLAEIFSFYGQSGYSRIEMPHTRTRSPIE